MPKKGELWDPSERRGRGKSKRKSPREGVTRRQVGRMASGAALLDVTENLAIVGIAGAAIAAGVTAEEAKRERERHAREPSEDFELSVARQMRRYDNPSIRRGLRTPLQVTMNRENGMAPIRTMHESTRLPLRPEYANIDQERVPTRIDYVRAYVMEHETERLSPVIRAELSSLLPALPAQESQYNNDARSGANAQLLFQIIPATRARLYRQIKEKGLISYDDPEMHHLVTQVVAVGEYFGDIHDFLQKPKEEGGARESLEQIRSEFFNNNQEQFDQFFMTPVLIDAYHAGEGTLIDIINWFAEHYPTRIALSRDYPGGYGYDLFHLMSELAKSEADHRRHERDAGRPYESDDLIYYGSVSRLYVDGVYAYRTLIEREMEEQHNRQ